jgi:hypothetical protein
MAEKSEKLSFEIPVQGSLGILAFGAQGIKAWRKKRLNSTSTNPPQPKNEQ